MRGALSTHRGPCVLGLTAPHTPCFCTAVLHLLLVRVEPSERGLHRLLGGHSAGCYFVSIIFFLVKISSSLEHSPMSLKTERINLGTTPPQEDREKGPPGRHQDGNPTPTGRLTPGAEKRGVSEDEKVMHPSSRSPQNSSGRKSPVQASQAATLQEQTAAAGGADGSSSVLESSEGVFLSHVQADELTGSSPNIEELQNLPVNPPPSLETAQPMDTKMKKEEVQEEKRHPNGKADDGRCQFPGALHAAPSRQATGP
uniref:Uncharacterized protein n=1 Tax=Rhinopithecus roxellana TaxID=61622 RepID=A0A2K6R7P7_RHIRO